MQEARIMLVRHARTVWNSEQRFAGHTDVPLAVEADLQIRQLTRELLQEPVTAIYSSPLSRCRLTVEPLAEVLGLTVIEDYFLQERNLGSWEGRSAASLSSEYPNFHYPLSAYSGQFAIPEAETLECLAERVKKALTTMRDASAGGITLAATHAGVMWTIMNQVVSNPPPVPMWPANSTPLIVEARSGKFFLSTL